MEKAFRPIPLEPLARWIFRDLKGSDTVLGIPRDNIAAPARRLGTELLGRRFGVPLGVAAGPHTQLAQNIVASWLCGARFIELKTVQILDELTLTSSPTVRPESPAGWLAPPVRLGSWAECLAALLVTPQALLSPCPGVGRSRDKCLVRQRSDTARSASRALSFPALKRRGLSRSSVSRPCIDSADETYNCEWPQELKLEESFVEYLKAWVLIHALAHALGRKGLETLST
jgi:hypothetical protein